RSNSHQRFPPWRQRVKFFKPKQNQDESINEWFVQVKKAAMECKFQASVEEYVKNKFITGMCRENVLDKLCKEDVSKSLQELVDIAVCKEASLQESVAAPINKLTICKKQESGRTKTIPKFKLSEQKSQSEKNNTNALCYGCGRTSHDFNKKCKFKASYCRVCHKKGHISLHLFVKGRNLQKHNVMALIGNIDLNLELDSGSGVSDMPLSLYQEHFSNYQLAE
ncbi:hypothetical protein ILUMI_19030, partial [Ignelater luminosus]